VTTADPRAIFGELMDVKDDVDYSSYTPEMIEQDILSTAARLELSPKFIRNAHKYLADQRQAYLQAHALARREARNQRVAAGDRKAEADLATMELLKRYDDAKILYDYVVDLEKALSKKLSSLQTAGGLMKAAFGATR
jgi:hypothetical protein